MIYDLINRKFNFLFFQESAQTTNTQKHHANTLFSTNTEYKTIERSLHKMHDELHTNITLDLYVAYRLYNKDHAILKLILERKYDLYAKTSQIELILHSPYNLPKGLLIKGLLERGYTTEKVEEWTGASKANISYHKLNNKEYNYFHPGIKLLIENPYGNMRNN